MPDENTPLPVPTTPVKDAHSGVPSPVPEGDVQAFTRAFASGAKPVLLGNAKIMGGAAALLLISIVQHWSGKADTEKVEKKVDEATKTTDDGFKAVVPRSNEISDQLSKALARIEALEVTTKAQSALIVARERDFVVEGKPAPKRARRVDRGLVEAVRANAVKDSKELEARKAKPVPVLKPLSPIELLAPPGGAGGAPPPTAPPVSATPPTSETPPEKRPTN
jgi:hypothetical protein